MPCTGAAISGPQTRSAQPAAQRTLESDQSAAQPYRSSRTPPVRPALLRKHACSLFKLELILCLYYVQVCLRPRFRQA